MMIKTVRAGTRMVGLCFAALLSIAPVWAAPIIVVNPSFETLSPGGLPRSCGPDCSYSSFLAPESTSIPDWNFAGGDYGQFRPGSNPIFVAPTDGITAAYVSGTLSQTVGETVRIGGVYTLLVDIEVVEPNGTVPGSADLLVNGVRYMATGVAPTAPNWSTYTATYIGLAADAGQAITVELNAPPRDYYDPYGRFDNVRLSTNLPEPACIGIVTIGLMGLLVLARRRAS